MDILLEINNLQESVNPFLKSYNRALETIAEKFFYNLVMLKN